MRDRHKFPREDMPRLRAATPGRRCAAPKARCTGAHGPRKPIVLTISSRAFPGRSQRHAHMQHGLILSIPYILNVFIYEEKTVAIESIEKRDWRIERLSHRIPAVSPESGIQRENTEDTNCSRHFLLRLGNHHRPARICREHDPGQRIACRRQPELPDGGP